MSPFRNISILLLICTTAFGQIKKNDILGEWQTKNDDSLYYHSDTIKLYQDINYFYDSKTCNLIRWTIDKRNFNLSNIYISKASERESYLTDKMKLRLIKTDFGQVIQLERSNQLFDKFKLTNYHEKVIDRYPYKVRELRLMRFDNLSQRKLHKYVDSLIHKVYFDSTFIDSTYMQSLDNEYFASLKIRMQEGFKPNPEPMILLNGYIVDNDDILKQIRLVETKHIKYNINLEETISIYGYKALNGIIDISISKKKFKEIWKNYGR